MSEFLWSCLVILWTKWLNQLKVRIFIFDILDICSSNAITSLSHRIFFIIVIIYITLDALRIYIAIHVTSFIFYQVLYFIHFLSRVSYGGADNFIIHWIVIVVSWIQMWHLFCKCYMNLELCSYLYPICSRYIFFYFYCVKNVLYLSVKNNVYKSLFKLIMYFYHLLYVFLDIQFLTYNKVILLFILQFHWLLCVCNSPRDRISHAFIFSNKRIVLFNRRLLYF
jgi:hypothetical protein